MIYFILDRAAGLVKIGFASDPWRRLSQVQTHNAAPLEIVALCEGDMADEAVMHQRFATSRVRGEWFTFCSDIEALVASLGAAIKPPIVSKTKAFWGKSAAEVSRLSGLSKSFISRIQSGETRPSPEVAIQLQRLTGVSAIRLVFGDLADEAA